VSARGKDRWRKRVHDFEKALAAKGAFVSVKASTTLDVIFKEELATLDGELTH